MPICCLPITAICLPSRPAAWRNPPSTAPSNSTLNSPKPTPPWACCICSKAPRDDARRAFERAVSLNPAYHMALMWLGSAIAMQGNVQRAHDYYLKAYRLDPLHPVINQNLAASFASLGDYSSAFRVLDKLDARYDRAGRLVELELMLAEQTGNFERTERVTGALLGASSTPDSLRGLAYRALWGMHQRRAQPDIANRYLERAQALGPLDLQFSLSLARRYAREGAREAYRNVLARLGDEHAEKVAYTRKPLDALLLLRDERYEEAGQAFEAAMARSGGKKPAYPVDDLFCIGHLLIVYTQLGNAERLAHWREHGQRLIARAERGGLQQFDFLVESAYFHAAAGNAEAAAGAFWRALNLGRLAPWELTEDSRVSAVRNSKPLQPLLAEARRTWTA